MPCLIQRFRFRTARLKYPSPQRLFCSSFALLHMHVYLSRVLDACNVPPPFFSFLFIPKRLCPVRRGGTPCSSYRRRGFIRVAGVLGTTGHSYYNKATRRTCLARLCVALRMDHVAPSHASSPRPVDLARGHGPLLSARIALRRPSLSLKNQK